MRALSLLLVSAIHAAGCSCAWFASAKTAWQGSTMVFVGRAESTWLDGGPLFRLTGFVYSLIGVRTPGPQRASVRAVEVFKGARAGELYEFRQPGSSCDMQFHEGTKYLVYAVRDSSRAWTAASGCGGSTYVDQAADDLRFLRALPGSAAGTRLSGRVEGLPGIRVRILDSGGRLTATAVTGADSVYEVYRLPPGRYTVEPVLPTTSGYTPFVTGRRGPYTAWVELGRDAGESVSFYAREW